MVCWPSIESKGSLDGHVGLVRALKPRNLLAWTYSEKVMHACLQMHVGGFGYQFRAKITLWYVPNAVFNRLFTFKLINLCVLNFALDLVEFSSKLESVYIYIYVARKIHKLHIRIRFPMRYKLHHQITCYWTIPTIHAPILSCNACMWATCPLPRSRAMGKRKAWQARLERVDEEDGEAGNFYKSWSSLEILLDQ